ncbi:sensor histidine kinase [Paenibacillus endoradicis]|uniref:sensor histidine kinase n=1 Tax=Paenibacillus endoradicis TaxID=2972487 RepID=UPI002158B2B6|nr:sensor histidine kinase [Paenibacillus endoradicis]MCR8660229.1 histidine kinase [Paenibacillus endoradicis]
MIWDAFKRMSLRNKLILTSILCMMVPTIIMLYNTSYFSQKIIQDQALDRANQSLRIVQNQLHNLMEEMIQVTNQVQFNEDMQSLLHQPSSTIIMRDVTTQLERVASIRSDIYLTLLMKDDRSFSNYSFYEANPDQFREEEWFDNATQLRPYETLYLGVRPNYIKSKIESDPYVIMTVRALTDYNGKPFAYLIVSRTENTFSSFMDQLSESTYLLDDKQKIIVQADDELIGKSFDRLITEETSESSGVAYVDGQNQIYVSMPLKLANWKLVSLVPYEQFTNRLGSIYKSGIMLQMIFIALFLAILTYFLNRFTKPIKALSVVALRVEAGDLHYRSNVRSGDEVGRLGRAFDNMLDRITEMIEQVKGEQKLKRQAELAMLQVQINPHFLLNVLNSIRMKLLLKENNEEAELVGSLSKLLRATLTSQQEYVSLRTEIDVTVQYMELMGFSTRYPIETIVDISNELYGLIVPRFILQPIVENCYKYGFVRKGGNIVITVKMANNNLTITIEDNGRGMKQDIVDKVNSSLKQNRYQITNNQRTDDGNTTGIGLINVFNRLKLIYGENLQMKLSSIEQEGTKVTLVFPADELEEIHHV